MFENVILTKVSRVTKSVSVKGKDTTVSNRRFFGLSFCIEGQITYIHKGKEYVSNPQTAVLLPKGQTYRLRRDQDGLFPVINFECEGLEADTHRVIPIGDAVPYLREFEQMEALSLLESNRLRVMAMFYQMLYRLDIEAIASPLQPALQYIERHYTDADLSISELAEQCRISEVYFRRLFGKRYGQSPKQFLTELRINRACQLLAGSGLKIAAVAEQCGYAGPYHFCRAFKAQTGQTPTEYMMQNRRFEL